MKHHGDYNLSMGWLEVLSMLKRLLPLLSRVAPMLETYVAARGATRGDSNAIDRLQAEMTAQLAMASEKDDALHASLEAQSARLQKISDELRHLRDADVARTVQLEQLDGKLAAGSRLLKILAAVTVVLLLTCAAMLAVLLLRH